MVYFRTDMNNIIATGHVMRCLAIASAVRSIGEEAAFILADDNAKQLIEAQGFETIILGSDWKHMDEELPRLLEVIKDRDIRAVLIDSYQVTESYLERLKEYVYTMYIDDLGQANYPADCLICYAVYWRKFNYQERYKMQRLLLGTAYTPLRNEFRGNGAKKIEQRVKNLLIMSGGSDRNNIISQILDGLELDVFENIYVICGRYGNYKELAERYKAYPALRFIESTDKLGSYMDMADMAVSAAGVTLYELCALGVPTVSYTIADNQRENALQFDRDGLIEYAGDIASGAIGSSIAQCLGKYIDNYEERQSRSLKMQRLVDGMGAVRIAEELVRGAGLCGRDKTHRESRTYQPDKECQESHAYQPDRMIGVVAGAGGESIYAIQTAKKLGFYVIAFDGNPDAPGLQYADESYVVDIREPRYMIEKLGNRRPDAVIPVPIGRYLISGAYLNDYYGLKGLPYKAALLCTDKYEFHRRLHAAGLRECECILIKAGERFDDKNIGAENMYMPEINFPAVLKPRYGSGSRAVELADGADEMNKALREILPSNEDFLLEEALQGEELGVDGAYIGGELKLILIRKKIITPPPARQCVGYISVRDSGLYNELGIYLKKAMDAIGMENTLFHADIMKNGHKYGAIEISGRPSGHRLHDLFTPLVTGVDMIKEFLTFSAGGKADFGGDTDVWANAGADCVKMIRYFDFENVEVTYVPDEKEISERFKLLSYQCNIKAGDIMDKVTDGSSIMGRGYFIAAGESEEAVIKTGEAVLSSFGIIGKADI